MSYILVGCPWRVHKSSRNQSREREWARKRIYIRGLKQQRRRRLRKRYSKSEVALLLTLLCLFHLVHKCWQLFSGVQFLKTVSKFRRRKRKSWSCVPVRHKTRKLAFSCRSSAVTAKKCTKKRAARAKLLFANLNQLFFCRSC